MENIEKGEVIFGAHPVREALKSKKRNVLQLYITGKHGGKQREEIIRLAKTRNVKIKSVEPKFLDAMAGRGNNHQGLVARVEPLKAERLSNAIYEAAGKKDALWLAIDEVTDPQNLGSMLRSAACLGFSVVLLPARRTVGINSTVYKVSSGALENITVVEVPNLTTAILDLKEEGFWIYGADMAGDNIPKVKYAYPALLVIGSEYTGLREKTREHCDQIVAVPQQKGALSSLNAAAAAAIIMYDMYAKLKFK
ncbi:MAG: 23S rRNA (guanosine(2251)-2'-O)-methyltransferase RlmB [Elusimicrobiota bacterium]|jgi:23S rRNA (guanosine2251-2'-O)-methyltransferase|nr:23S rRNA (guanosine(2251)-2'-O)-methyltransferase RlmB [Elusimicrobiota bacterium]